MIGLLQQVGGWDGFEVAHVTNDETLAPDVHGMPAPRLVIELRPAADHVKRCSQCGAAVTRVHETTTRRVRVLAVMEWDTGLLVPRARVKCPRCGPWVFVTATIRYVLPVATAGLGRINARPDLGDPVRVVQKWYDSLFFRE